MKKSFFLSFRTAFVCLSATAAVLQLLALLFAHDAGTHYFQRGTVLPILSIVCAVLGALCGTIVAFGTDAKKLNEFPFSGEISASPMALGFIAVAIVLVITEVSTVAKVTAILMLLSAIFEILLGHPKTQRATPTAFLGLATVIGLILLNAVYYFDTRMEMNSPLKVSVQNGLLVVMLAKTSELRYLLGKPQPRMLLVLSAWTASVGALSALSLPAAYLLMKTDRMDFATSETHLLLYAAGGFLILCATISSLLRIRALFNPPSPENTPDDTAENTDAFNGKDLT